jgi:Iap family predicted aminopeptidase
MTQTVYGKLINGDADKTEIVKLIRRLLKKNRNKQEIGYVEIARARRSLNLKEEGGLDLNQPISDGTR